MFKPMKTLLTALFIMATLAACEKDEKPNPPPSNPVNPIDTTDTVVPQGKVIFYNILCAGCSYGSGTRVSVNSEVFATITNAPNFIPSCGSFWGKTFTGDTGTYTYRMERIGAAPKVQNGSFYLTKDTCISIGFDPQ